MINIEHFNTRSPYPITPAIDEGFYDFTTDSGVRYSMGFLPDDSIVSQGAYQFIISNTNHQPSPKDEKVREVVTLLVDEFFNSSVNVMLYICETGDGKQSIRNRLFQHWFSMYERQSEFTFISSSIIDEDGQINYATLIARNDNPNLSQAVKEFTDTIQLFNSKP